MRPRNLRGSSRTCLVVAKALTIVLVYGLLVVFAEKEAPTWRAIVPILACAFILSGFLNAAHDCVHGTHLRGCRVNRTVGAAWCTPILINFTVYRCQHLVHHRYTGVEGDTETHARFASVGAYFRAHTGLGFWRGIASQMLKTARLALPDSVLAKRAFGAASTDHAVVCAWLVGMAALTAFHPALMLVAYWLPLLAYPAFATFFSLPEHYSLSGGGADAARSRNVTSNPVVRFFQWNANFHADHHREPGIPATALGERHRRRGEDADEPTERSYLGFHWSVVHSLLLATADDSNRKGGERERGHSR